MVGRLHLFRGFLSFGHVRDTTRGCRGSYTTRYLGSTRKRQDPYQKREVRGALYGRVTRGHSGTQGSCRQRNMPVSSFLLTLVFGVGITYGSGKRHIRYLCSYHNKYPGNYTNGGVHGHTTSYHDGHDPKTRRTTYGVGR